MEKNLLKKTSAFIVIAMMFSAVANAQIVYKDVIPDKVLSLLNIAGTLNYNIDLNNDSISDYKITVQSVRTGCSQWSGVINYISAMGFDSNAVVTATNVNNPLAMNFNDVISSGATFFNSGYLKYRKAGQCGNSTSGVWPNLIDHYLGLKLIVGSNTYYGWARMQINLLNPTSCIIKDYAYNSIPNQPILAGETSCTTPTVNLTQSGPLSFCNGDSVTLTANGTGYQYQWKKNNVNIAGATAKTYVAKTTGIYKCKVTNSCGSKTSGTRTVTVPCRNTDASFLSMTSNELEHLSVYPNPATNNVTIKFPSDEAGEIQVVNLFGQIVYSGKTNAEQTQIDVSSFAAGMYVIRWSSGENFETKTFSVTK